MALSRTAAASSPSSSIAKKVKEERDKYLSYGIYLNSIAIEDLDYYVKEFMERHPDKDKFVAVDLSSGYGTVPINLSLRYRKGPNAFPASLEFIPCCRNIDDQLKSGLRYMKDQEQPLLVDNNNETIYAGEHVKLTGLVSNTKLNDKEAYIICRDSKQDGRFAVQLVRHADVNPPRFEKNIISVKSSNLLSYPINEYEMAVLRRSMTKQEQDGLYQGLIDRAVQCRVPLTKDEAHSGGTAVSTAFGDLIRRFGGQCAMVTLIDDDDHSSTSEISWWFSTFMVASKLLMDDGMLVITSTFKGPGKFGDIMAMQSVARQLDLSLMAHNSNFLKTEQDDEKIAILWKKVGRNAASFEGMSFGWKPTIPTMPNLNNTTVN